LLNNAFEKMKEDALRSIIFIFILIPFYLTAGGERFYEMSNVEIDSLLKVIYQEPFTITEKMNKLSEYFLGTPYDFKCVGDGKDALMEKYPLVNFEKTNCMALCEHVLALSISDSWDNFFNNLMHIRYKDGLIGMKTRNHYTMADWLPQNRWLLDDVSEKVGGGYIKKMTRTISHRRFFAGKGITDMRYVQPDTTITINYIPLKYWDEVEGKLKKGDILTLLFAEKEDVFAAHMVIFVVGSDGADYIREATTRKMNVVIDTPFGEWVNYKQKNSSKLYAGMAVLRVKENLNSKGKIIYPGDICKMKVN
jgi:hypothetical protein